MIKVYFIKCNDFVKIGQTNNVKQRIKDLQTGNPHELQLLKTINADIKIEVQLHKQFSHLNIRGEWFALTADLIDFINKLDSKKKKSKQSTTYIK